MSNTLIITSNEEIFIQDFHNVSEFLKYLEKVFCLHTNSGKRVNKHILSGIYLHVGRFQLFQALNNYLLLLIMLLVFDERTSRLLWLLWLLL